MPLIGPVPKGGTFFFCPHCGAMYSADAFAASQERQRILPKCVVCKQTMDERGKVPLYKLIHRPEEILDRLR